MPSCRARVFSRSCTCAETGDALAAGFLVGGCFAAFPDYVGLAYEESTLDYQMYQPLAEGWNELDDRAVDTARVLAMDAVHTSASGHLGLPLGCAELGAVLFGHALQHNPDDANWLKHTMLRKTSGGLELTKKTVSITEFQPKERKY